jgi:hypothetical protein
VIKEKEGAVDYIYKGGNIELRNVAFKHLLTAPIIGKGRKVAVEPTLN